MAKDILERFVRVHFDDNGDTLRDLSADVVPGSLNGLGGKIFDEIEMTGLSDAHKHFLAGHWSHEFSCQFYMNDTATTGAYTVLSNMEGSVGDLSIRFGTDGAPASGDPAWEGDYLLVEAPIQIAGGKPVLACRFIPGSATAPDWTTVS